MNDFETNLHRLADDLGQSIFAQEVAMLVNETPDMLLRLLAYQLENGSYVTSPGFKMICILYGGSAERRSNTGITKQITVYCV